MVIENVASPNPDFDVEHQGRLYRWIQPLPFASVLSADERGAGTPRLIVHHQTCNRIRTVSEAVLARHRGESRGLTDC